VENQRVPIELDPKLALGLLGQIEFGRVAFVSDGRPTIRPLNHVVVDGQVIVHTRHTTAFARAVRGHAGLRVAYHADEIERHSRLGWSVLVSGTATDITDDRRAERLGPQVRSWMSHPLDTVIAIEPLEITGLRLTVPR
jgi:nitroimidazol reductase NimA-like FMN-containing flavoprotein (pyridoxamine 5'-phosphate oxidase superfamily)